MGALLPYVVTLQGKDGFESRPKVGLNDFKIVQYGQTLQAAVRINEAFSKCHNEDVNPTDFLRWHLC